MDSKIWFMLTAVLLVAAHADSSDKGPQMFESQPRPAPQKQHKRDQQQQKYEMKEVILYLTPTQIRGFESGQGLIDPQPPRPDVLPVEEQIKQGMQNLMNEEKQKLQKQIENLETNKKQQMQLEEAINNDKSKSKEKQKLASGNKLQPTKPDVQKREKYMDVPLQLQLIPTSQLKYQGVPQETPQLNTHAIAPQLEQQGVPQSYQHFERQFPNHDQQLVLRHPHFEQQVIPPPVKHFEQQVYAEQGQHFDHPVYLVPEPHFEQKIPQLEQQELPTAVPHLEQPIPHLEQPIPHLEQPIPHLEQPTPLSALRQFQIPLFQQLHSKQVSDSEGPVQDIPVQQEKTQWHPQNYAYLYFYPNGKPANAEKLQLFHPYSHEKKQKHVLIQKEQVPVFRHPKFQLVPYEYALQNKLEAQHILQAQLDEHRLDASRLDAYKLEPHQLEDIDSQKVIAQKELENEYMRNHQIETEQLEAQRAQEAIESEQIRELKSQPIEDEPIDIEHFKELQKQQMREIEEAHKLKAKYEAEEKEAHRLDAQLEAEQIKAEQMRQEQNRLEYLRKLQPKKTQMHSILTPLFQGHSITESLEQQKATFPHHQINLEKGFKPLHSQQTLQYAPEFNNEKYAREVEKILKRNYFEKQRALAKVAEIANSPPEIIHSEEKVKEPRPMEVIKHVQVSVPTPVYVPVPEPFEVKVPQPYAVPLEIIRPVPIPILKMEKVEVEKRVPVEVEKHVPVPVTKNVYVPVDKPYFVKKVVPVEVKKEIKVEIPIRNSQKLSIIRHVWEH